MFDSAPDRIEPPRIKGPVDYLLAQARRGLRLADDIAVRIPGIEHRPRHLLIACSIAARLPCFFRPLQHAFIESEHSRMVPRSEERRGGKEGVRTGSFRGVPEE